MKHLLIPLGLAASLAACASVKTPQQGIYVAGQALVAAQNIATLYEALPTCVTGGPAACSDPATVTKIQAASQTATVAWSSAAALASSGSASSSALTSAESNAEAAITALTALTTPLASTVSAK